MGMDVYGAKPWHPCGKYFRASIWSWPGVVEAMKIASPHEHEQIGPGVLFNDNAGLDDEDAFVLGGNLLIWLDDNIDVQRFSVDREALPPFYREMEQAIQGLRAGTMAVDKDTNEIRPVRPGDSLLKPDGFKGGPDSWDDPFSASRDLVADFARFAIHSGGFRIA